MTSLNETSFVCYEMAAEKPFFFTDIYPFLPKPQMWKYVSYEMSNSKDHGFAHWTECVTWAVLLVPVFLERGINDISPVVIKHACGIHDIGRRDDHPDNHGDRSVLLFLENYKNLTDLSVLPEDDLSEIARLCLLHSSGFKITDDNNLRALRFIDVLTIAGRYAETKEIEWPEITAEVLNRICPQVNGKAVLSINECQRLLDLEKSMHKQATEIAKKQGISNFRSTVASLIKFGLISKSALNSQPTTPSR